MINQETGNRETTGQKIYQGIVTRKVLGSYTVNSQDGSFECSISSKLRKSFEHQWKLSKSDGLRKVVRKVKGIRTVDPVAIGDRVRFYPVTGTENQGRIIEILERKNKLSRMAAGPVPIEQVIVSNIDLVVPVFSVKFPKPKWAFLDRYLIAAEMNDVPSVIIITKSDLLDSSDAEDEKVFDIYRQIGYNTIVTSVVSGQGVDEVRDVLAGKVSVFVGRSGTGKTSLLNALLPGAQLKVGEISKATSKGKHTTSYIQMFPVQPGGWIVDSPGMREFGLWKEPSKQNLDSFFKEMRPFIGACKYKNSCLHKEESGCAVKDAVKKNIISKIRYNSYIRMLEGLRL